MNIRDDQRILLTGTDASLSMPMADDPSRVSF